MNLGIIYIIIHSIAAAYAEFCEVNNDIPCSYTIICTDVFELNVNWDSFRYFPEQVPYDENCHQFVSYNGYNMNQVTLVFKQTDTERDVNNPVPYNLGDWNVHEMLKIIHTLNLSENSYRETPTITSMINLKVLNISRNELTTAVLSNPNPLFMLTQLDLSYNMITDIKINTEELAYTKLTVIDLSHNYLVNLPDAVFDLFDDLSILDLSYNYIDILGQFTFEGIKNLKVLNLSNNRLIDINSSLFRFSELLILNLSANKIEKINSNDFKQLVKLKTLDLSLNKIKTIDINVLQAMVSLQSLDLSHNSIEVVDKNIFSNLQLLDKIDLANNKIKTLPLHLFKNISLSTFYINDNRLEGVLQKGMFEGVNVISLDISYQFLTEVQDYTFYNLLSLGTLILKSNRIHLLTNLCFKTLVNLQVLDLSNNQITSLNFDKEDLGNLQSFILNNNRLTDIKHEELQHLINLEYLDVSGNMIAHLESSSFRFLKRLINLAINNNPLEGVLETDTFDGLVLLPNLDISHTMLTTIKNASFNDMTTLKNLDMSFCNISQLQYNAFVHTGYIEILDLSHNKLKDFFVNTTELVGLLSLFLHNNLIKSLSPIALGGLSRLNNITLSHNAIVSVDGEVLNTLVDLRYLDVSYNPKFNVTGRMLSKVKELNTLILSGIRATINFAHFVQDNQISNLVITNASIQNVSDLYLRGLGHVETLDLSCNNISKLQIEDFSGLNVLRYLDLSFNKIAFIQPGTFKNNSLMTSLNISHNCLYSISYGILHGLHYLSILDISYNNIKDLQGERFYELNFLNQLIADHNKIDSLNAEQFLGSNLRRLSIGDNPLSCDILVKLRRNPIPFEITAIRLDEHTNENVQGVVCNKAHVTKTTVIPKEHTDNIDVLNSLQNILYNLSKHKVERDNKDIQYLEKISNLLGKSNSLYDEKLTNLINLTSNVVTINNRTNTMFNDIIRLLDNTRQEIISTSPEPPAQVVTLTNIRASTLSYNSSSNQSIDIISYINNMKKELENTIAVEKQNFMREFKSQFDHSNYKTESVTTADIDHEKLVSSNDELSKSLFIETCVALILIILVGLVLYKFYKSRMFIRNRFSLSTRELPGAMENSNL